MRIAVLVSGSGSNLQSFIDKRAQGLLNVEIALVASNNPQAFGLERAKAAGIATWCESHKNYPSRQAFDEALTAAIKKSGAELVVLAGYMRLLSSSFLEAFKNRVINIHPALLPSFPGVHGAADALAYGVKLSGCTVHFVEEEMDSGPVIIQAAVPALAGESRDELQQRIHAMEHRIYPQAIEWLATGRVKLEGRTVSLLEADLPKVYPSMNANPASQWLVWPALEQGF